MWLDIHNDLFDSTLEARPPPITPHGLLQRTMVLTWCNLRFAIDFPTPRVRVPVESCSARFVSQRQGQRSRSRPSPRGDGSTTVRRGDSSTNRIIPPSHHIPFIHSQTMHHDHDQRSKLLLLHPTRLAWRTNYASGTSRSGFWLTKSIPDIQENDTRYLPYRFCQ
jgi:hypothetical protein